MGAHGSKQYSATELDEYRRSIKIGGRAKGKRRKQLKRAQLDKTPGTFESTSFPLDEDTSIATTTNTERSLFPEDPESHSIELCTINTDTADDSSRGPAVSHQVTSSPDLGSGASAFHCCTPSNKSRERAFAVDWTSPRRENSTAAGKPRNLPSYSSPHLLARRTWLLNEADKYEKEGNFPVARPYLEECIRLDESLQVHFLAATFVYHKLGVLTWKIGAYNDSVAVLTKCLSLFDSNGHQPSSLGEIQGLVGVLMALGRVHISLCEYDPAIEYIRKCVEVLNYTISCRPEVVDTIRPLIAQGLVCMGVVDDARGHSIRAMNTFQTCLQIQRSCLHARFKVDVAARRNSRAPWRIH